VAALPYRGQQPRPGKAGSALKASTPLLPSRFAWRPLPCRGQQLRPGKAGSTLLLVQDSFCSLLVN